MNAIRAKIREDMAALKAGESLPYLIKSPKHRLSAYNSAKRLGIKVVIRESLQGDGHEVVRTK